MRHALVHGTSANVSAQPRQPRGCGLSGVACRQTVTTRRGEPGGGAFSTFSLMARISEVAEIVGSEEGVIQLNKIFEWNPESDTIENVSISSKTLSQIANLSGKSLYEINKEIESREMVLKYMINHNIHSEDDVNGILELYYANPQKVLNRIVLNR